MNRPERAQRRRWWAVEVVQTSAMDCGPAALKSVLEGFRIPVSYGRLREACQTDIDGTSIDTLEAVAPLLGVAAEQIVIPPDHVALVEAAALPAIAVVKLPDGPAHFVVVWRRIGPWLQLMDPATGRRWVHQARFQQALYSHEQAVPAAPWRAWAASGEFTQALRRRMADLGLSPIHAAALQQRADADAGWFGYAALDACTRLAQSLVASGAIAVGREADALLRVLFERVGRSRGNGQDVVPARYWSVVPHLEAEGRDGLQLHLRGAVLVRMTGRMQAPALLHAGEPELSKPAEPTLSPELAAALHEQSVHPLATVWRLLRQDGLLAPLALSLAMILAAASLVLETLLLRGAITIATQLGTSPQRLVALAALLCFVAVLLALELPIVRESLRHGRQLEMRLRIALLAKLPHLPDRYFQSRSVSDMAERGHLLQLSRQLPSLGLGCVQSVAELVFTLAGIALIAPASAPWALCIAAMAIALPLLMQPLLSERDLRLRNHSSALHAFCLDALLGVVPARTHGAEPALRRQHESLLVQWVGAGRHVLRASLAMDGIQSLLCSGLAAALLFAHFSRTGSVGGADLLLVYWALKLSAIGHGLAGRVLQYPAQRNVLMRLMEPLAAPDDSFQPAASARPSAKTSAVVHTAASVCIRQGEVIAAGHVVLQEMNLQVSAGEHVAIVGASGAGKSTLLALLLGWHRLARGELLVDDQPLDAQALRDLRPHIAWVEPGVQLWNRSLVDNLTYASGESGLPRMGAAMAAARLREVLEKLPDGLQTRLGEGGALLSGGEGQRVRLARAFMQDGVRLALLDEPFRGLDRGQRAQMLADARRWWKRATLLCVTHDVGETLAFDRVLVVEQGRIVEDGAPHALAQRETRYAALLQAEQRVHEELWQGAHWRRMTVERGTVWEGPMQAAQDLSEPQPAGAQALYSQAPRANESPATTLPAR